MQPVTDERLEKWVSTLLRTGVLLAGAVVLAGGIFYLLRHGGEPVNYHDFHEQPSADRLVSEIIRGTLLFRSRSIIQLGILLLIATPIARVVTSFIGFAFERDRTYMVITLIVFCILLYGLSSGLMAG